MNVVYILPVHKSADQVLRLLARLQSDQALFVVHVDAKAPASVEQRLRQGTRELPSVHFLERKPCYWAGFGIVDVALRAIEHCLKQRIDFDYAFFVTGQDYPLRPAESIERFLDGAGGASFVNHWKLPTPYWGADGGLARIQRWHLVSRTALHLRVPWPRRVPGGLAPFGGEAHWCLARQAAEYVADVVRRDRRLVRFFEHVLHPDEILVQTLLMNSELAATVVDDHLRYIDWSAVPGPKILTSDDFAAVTSSGKLFARKFDVTRDATILDLLDDHIEAQRRAPTH
jgi:hypothetical protein